MSLTVSTTQTTELKIKPRLKTALTTELTAYAKLHTQLKGIEAEMEQRKAKIGRYREEVGVESLELEGFHVTRVSGGTRGTLNKMKLLEMGCTVEMLEEATEYKPVKPFEKVTCPKVGGED